MATDLRHLQTLRAAVDHGSFAGAAGELGCAQSTVTLHIQELEADLGVRLFERSGRTMRLTDAGRTVYEHGTAVLNGMESLAAAVQPFARGLAGTLRLGSIEPTATQRLPGVLAPYLQAHPGVDLSVRVGGTGTLVTALSRRELDLAIVTTPPSGFDLQFEVLFKEELALLLPSGDPLAGRATVSAKDLAGRRLLVTEPACVYRQATEAAIFAGGVQPARYIEIDRMETVLASVRAGLGLAFVPAALAADRGDGTVVRRMRGERPIALAVGIARPRGSGRGQQALRALVDALRSGLHS